MPRYRLSIDVPRWLDKVIIWPVLVWRWFWYDHTFRRVKLLPDKYAKVEARDFHEVSQHIWWVKDNDGTFKAVRFLPGGNCGLPVYMHRQIMEAKKGEIIDHSDRDGLNNLRSNLRAATKSQNNMNRSGQRGTSSKYKGVSWFRATKDWRAMIHIEGKCHFLGHFESEIEAAKAYDEAARKYHGDFAYLNFSDDSTPLTRRARIRKTIKGIIHELTRIYTNIFNHRLKIYPRINTNLHKYV